MKVQRIDRAYLRKPVRFGYQVHPDMLVVDWRRQSWVVTASWNEWLYAFIARRRLKKTTS